MDAGYERAGRVEYAKRPRLRLLPHALRHAVRGEDEDAAVRDLGELLDEDRSPLPESVNDEAVVHHLVPDVNRCAELPERGLDNADRTRNASAEAPGDRKVDFHASPPFPALSSGLPSAGFAPPGLPALPPFSGCFRSKSASITSIAAPTQMALSAMLNAG